MKAALDGTLTQIFGKIELINFIKLIAIASVSIAILLKLVIKIARP